MKTSIKLLIMISFVSLFLSACGGGGSGGTTETDNPKTPTTKEIALNRIKAYASDSNNPAPSLEDYKNAGVTRINTENLEEINQLITTLTPADVDTTEELINLTTELSINISPAVFPGPNQTVQINQTVTITGSATDSDGTITSFIWKEGNTLLANSASFSYTPTTIGTHTLTLTVTDNDGASSSDSINVFVSTAPVTNQIPTADAGGDRTAQVNQGIIITGSGTDSDGTITSLVWSEGQTVLASGPSFTYTPLTIGSHTLILTVTDNQGAQAIDTMTVTASAEPDTTPPVITLNGSPTLEIAQGSPYQDPGASAFDNTDGVISTNIIVTGGPINTNAAPGTSFTLTYNVSDAAGNTATPKTRTINIVAATDNVSPVIMLNGSATVEVIEGAPYNDAGATATDNIDGNITGNIIVGGDTVNTNTPPGTTFLITYNVSDAAGNAAIQKTRTVTIIADPSGGHFIPTLSAAQIQDYLTIINAARAVATTCGGTGNYPAVPPVTWSNKLYKASYEHSQDLGVSNTWSHDGSGTLSDWTGYAAGKQSTFVERIVDKGYVYFTISENISAGTVRDTAQEAVDSWMASPGHCHNIMNATVTQVGMAHYYDAGSTYKHYWTQNFGKPQ